MLVWDDDEDEGLTVEQLPQPWRQLIERLEARGNHPARAWFEMIGNGVFEDDWGVEGLPAPAPVYRFRRSDRVAYIWPKEEVWIVCPWRRLRSQVRGTLERVASFRDALDVLTRKRRWWRFWG